MLLGASGSYKSYDFRGRRYTVYGSGIISVTSDKSTNLSGSTNVSNVSGDITQDLSLLADTWTGEIPHSTYVTSSAHTSPSVGKTIRQFSPHCNINFRRSFFDKHGYSQKIRNSPNQYLDEHFASRSFSQIPDANSYYYGSGQTAYQNGQIVKTTRNKSPNKFFAGIIGNPPDDLFQSYGSGNISSSWELDYDGDEITNKQYYKNNKKDLPYSLLPPMRWYDSIYGSAFDSLNYSLIFDDQQKIINGLNYNENWNSGSTTNAYVEQWRLSSGSLSRSYVIGDTIFREKGTEALASWYCSGKSGSLELKFNNKNINISNEKTTPNVAIIRSYLSTNSLTTASVGTGISGSGACWGEAGAQYVVYQLTSSFIINSCDCLRSCVSAVAYYDYIFSIKQPLVDISRASLHEGFSSTKGATMGIFLSYLVNETTYLYMLPIANFSIDGTVRIASIDNNYSPIFVDTNEKWENDILYKLSILLDFTNKKFVEIMLNGKYLTKIDLSTIIGAVVHYLNPNVEIPQVINDSLLTIAWAWFGSIDTDNYDEYEFFTIRCAKSYYYTGKAYNTTNDFYRYKLVNRYPKLNLYRGQLRKMHEGTINTGAKILNVNTDSNDYAVVISCSDNSFDDLRNRPCIYPIDTWNKLFQNNPNKQWHFFDGYFPVTSGW
jgi:hypothetical protein